MHAAHRHIQSMDETLPMNISTHKTIWWVRIFFLLFSVTLLLRFAAVRDIQAIPTCRLDVHSFHSFIHSSIQCFFLSRLKTSIRDHIEITSRPRATLKTLVVSSLPLRCHRHIFYLSLSRSLHQLFHSAFNAGEKKIQPCIHNKYELNFSSILSFSRVLANSDHRKKRRKKILIKSVNSNVFIFNKFFGIKLFH